MTSWTADDSIRAAGGFFKYYLTNFSSNVCHEDATQDEGEEDLRNFNNLCHFQIKISLGIMGLKC
jgi:hypothetical protein